MSIWIIMRAEIDVECNELKNLVSKLLRQVGEETDWQLRQIIPIEEKAKILYADKNKSIPWGQLPEFEKLGWLAYAESRDRTYLFDKSITDEANYGI